MSQKKKQKQKKVPPVTLKGEPSYQEVMAAIRARRKEQQRNGKKRNDR